MNEKRERELRFWLKVTAERDKGKNPTYYCVSGDTNPADAERQFRQKFGKRPDKTFNEFGLLWCGPVEE